MADTGVPVCAVEGCGKPCEQRRDGSGYYTTCSTECAQARKGEPRKRTKKGKKKGAEATAQTQCVEEGCTNLCEARKNGKGYYTRCEPCGTAFVAALPPVREYSNGRGPKCYNCGDFGHVSRDCPSAAQGPKCYNCGGFGHLSKECSAPAAN